MTIRSLILACSLPILTAQDASAAEARRRTDPPSPDPDRIINESYGFLKEREPLMTEVEYAMYEKVVPMVSARPEFALTLLESMVGQADTSAAFDFVLGNAYYEQRRYAEAEARLRTAIEKFPTFVRAWENLGVLYYATERHAEAVPCFSRVLALGETEPRVFGMLGFCQLRSGHALAAEASYLQAYSRDPDNADWLEGLLSTYVESGQHSRAEALLRRLVVLRPVEPRLWLLLAGMLQAQDRPVEAIAELDVARSLGALGQDGALLMGDLCAERGLHTEAVSAYRIAAKTAPDLGLPRLASLARSLLATGQADAAEAALSGADELAADVGRDLLMQVRAEVFLARGAWDAAAATLEQLVDRDPLNARALLDLGRAEEARGNDSRAIIHYESAAAAPGEPAYAANLRLANLLLRLRHYPEALAAVDRALAIRPGGDLAVFQARVRALAEGARR